MDDGLGVATKLELVFKSPLRQTFQDHLQVTESHKLDLWSLWILGHSLSDSETKKDSIGCVTGGRFFFFFSFFSFFFSLPTRKKCRHFQI